MATPPTHIYHSMLLHEALTAVHSSYGYGLLILYVHTHAHVYNEIHAVLPTKVAAQ